MLPGNAFIHLEHPRVAECPKNPQTFLDAGISHATQSNAQRTSLQVLLLERD